jgi:hypothetical protein
VPGPEHPPPPRTHAASLTVWLRLGASVPPSFGACSRVCSFIATARISPTKPGGGSPGHTVGRG